MGCGCPNKSQDKCKAPITGPAQAECIYDRQINSLVVSSTDDAKRLRNLEENHAVAGCFVVALFVFMCASLVAACAEVNRTRSQIDRLHADIDFLESQVFEAGRRK